MGIFRQFKLLFMSNLIFLLLLFKFNIVNISTNSLKKKKKKIGSINLINTQLILKTEVLKYFTALPHEKTLSQRLNIAHRILSKKAMWNYYNILDVSSFRLLFCGFLQPRNYKMGSVGIFVLTFLKALRNFPF